MIAEAIGLKHSEGWANDLLAEATRPAARGRRYWEAAAASQVELCDTVRRVWARVVRSLAEKGVEAGEAGALAEFTLKIAEAVASFNAVVLGKVGEAVAADLRDAERSVSEARRQAELVLKTARLKPTPDEARLQAIEEAMRRREGEDSLALLNRLREADPTE